MLRLLDGTETGTGLNRVDRRVSGRRGNVLALEVGQEISRAAREGSRAPKAVDLASVAEIGGAGRVGAGAWAGEELAGEAGLDGCSDVLEDVALGHNLGASADLEGMTGIIVPVVVDCVEEGVAADLGGTA